MMSLEEFRRHRPWWCPADKVEQVYAELCAVEDRRRRGVIEIPHTDLDADEFN